MEQAKVSPEDLTRERVQAILDREKIPFKAIHAGEQVNSEGWKHDAWAVTLGSWHTDYKTGLGWRIPRKYYLWKRSDPHARNCYCLTCRKLPTISAADVLHSLFLDSQAGSQSFEEWCSDFGYDTDSRKALDTYLKCGEIAKELRRIFSSQVRQELETLLEGW